MVNVKVRHELALKGTKLSLVSNGDGDDGQYRQEKRDKKCERKVRKVKVKTYP